MQKYDVRQNLSSREIHDVVDTATGEVAVIDDTWLGALRLEDAGAAADWLNAITARREGLLN